jgi:transcription elongation factor Elf1
MAEKTEKPTNEKPLTELPAVAQNVFTACKKCGEDRYHKVLAHKTASSASVQCEVCGAKKTFKLTKPKAPRKASSKKKDGKSASPAHPSWTTLNETIGAGEANNYKMSDYFKLNTGIQHPKFGLGYVVFESPSRIDVVFEDAVRSLVHNRGN